MYERRCELCENSVRFLFFFLFFWKDNIVIVTGMKKDD